MNFRLRLASIKEIDIAFSILKSTANTLAKKGINQWQYWGNPPQEKIQWVKDGFLNGEFFFIENNIGIILGMVRIQHQDLLYWGEMNDKAIYIHSLVVLEQYANLKIGKRVLLQLETDAKKMHHEYLRLDCDSKNKQLCEYYEKQGFKKIRDKKLPHSTNNLYQKKL